MFDIGWSELLIIAVVAIIIVGPRELPRMLYMFGQYMGKIRRVASEFQAQFYDAIDVEEFENVTAPRQQKAAERAAQRHRMPEDSGTSASGTSVSGTSASGPSASGQETSSRSVSDQSTDNLSANPPDPTPKT